MKTCKIWFSFVVTATLVLNIPLRSLAEQHHSGTFTTIDVPGAASTAGNPSPWLRINAERTVVGGYEDTAGKGHGFLMSRGNFITFDAADAVFTELGAINARGDILGDYLDTSSNFVAFLLSRGIIRKIQFPGATVTSLNSINSEGEIVGYYTYADERRHGFLLRRAPSTKPKPLF